MSNITAGVSYAASGGSAMFWFERLLNGYTPEQWAALAVLGSLAFAAHTYLTNLYSKVKEERRKEARGQ